MRATFWGGFILMLTRKDFAWERKVVYVQAVRLVPAFDESLWGADLRASAQTLRDLSWHVPGLRGALAGAGRSRYRRAGGRSVEEGARRRDGRRDKLMIPQRYFYK